jgi:hypothetical protein
MDLDQSKLLPFLNRDMLDFKHGTTFSLKATFKSRYTFPITISGMTRQGPFTFQITPLGTGETETAEFKITDIPIWVTASVVSTNYYYNSIYLKLGLLTNGDVNIELLAGYLYQFKALSWPQIASEPLLPQQQSYVFAHQSVNPAAGAEAILDVPSYNYWHVKAVNVQLVTGAAVANRTVHLRFNYPGAGVIESISPVVQPASTTYNYRFENVPAGGATNDNGVVIVPIPDNIWLPRNARITTETTNIQAADDFGILVAVTEDFFPYNL